MDLDRINELGFEKSSRWKSIVLVLSFSLWWNFFIACQCYFVFLLCTFQYAYAYDSEKLNAVRFVLDAFYLLDLICVLTYLRKTEYRKLRYTKVRSWVYIVLDIISLLPFSLIYSFHYLKKGASESLPRLLIQNRLLRIYRIFQLETFYEPTIRKTNQYLFYMLLQYLSKACLLGHITGCIYENMDKSFGCDSKKHFCLLSNISDFVSILLLNWSGNKASFQYPGERLLLIMIMSAALLLTYSYFYPNTFFVSMQLCNSRAKYYENKGKLDSYLKNMNPPPEIKEKITQYFKDVWLKDRGEEKFESTFENIPISLQKEIFTDIYWEAFRHSELFREVSRSCKRSLSMVMNTSFYHSGQVIYHKGETKMKFMFLVQGIMQIMAEENNESPVLSFSSGTVFGEFSMFHICESQALLLCKSYCELQTLQMEDAIEVLKDYPKDRKLVFTNLEQRLKMAKATQWRKKKFHLEFKIDSLGLTGGAIEDCVKWLKSQWRVSWEGHQRHKMVVRAREEGMRLPSWHRAVKPEIKIEFISNYLDLIVLSDALEERKDVVCLKTKFPWSINPSAPFLKKWKHLVIVTSLIPALIYPMCTGWFRKFPEIVYILSFIVTLIFIIDLIFLLLTAIKTKHGIITNFSSVLCYRIQQLTFYFDILAALPFQIYLIQNVDIDVQESFTVGIPLLLSIAKIHLFMSMKIPLCDEMDKLSVIKDSLITFLVAYWYAAVIQLFGVRNVPTSIPVSSGWYERFLTNKLDRDNLKFYYVALLRAFNLGLGLPDYSMYADTTFSQMYFGLVKLGFFFLSALFLGNYYAAHTIKIFAEETFFVLLKRIRIFYQNTHLSNETIEQILKLVRFQWEYNHADYLATQRSISKSMPNDMGRFVNEKTISKTLRLCKIFTDESQELINDLLNYCLLVGVPAHSNLVAFGQTKHTVSIIHRGFCQVTSFLEKDVSNGIGKSFVTGPGTVFPILSALTNSPCVESVFTLTDCELLMIQIDEVLEVLDKHDYFKDLVDVAKEDNIVKKLKRTRKGGIKQMEKKLKPEVEKMMYRESFQRLGTFGLVVHALCPRYIGSIENVSKWEYCFTLYTFGLCLVWPCCFGIFIYVSHILVPLFFGGTAILFVHLVTRFFTPYYNHLGILVTHPIYTSYHYIKTSFICDFIVFLPVYPVYRYFFSDPFRKPRRAVVMFSFFQHSLLILRIVTFFNYVSFTFSNKYYIRLSKVLTFFLLIFSYSVNFSMFLALQWITSTPYHVVGFTVSEYYTPDDPYLLHKDSLFDYFVFSTHWLFCSLTTVDFNLSEETGEIIYTVYAIAFVGHLIRFYLYSWISSNSVFANISGTMYKEKITSLVKFLEFEKADDKLMEYAISFFNLEWSLTQGECLDTMFKHLPTQIHEELVYPLYRTTFAKSPILAKADECFYKVLSTSVNTVYFNRGSIVTFQKMCQSEIYFIQRGKCFVYDWFVVLDAGSIIGDLQRTGLMVNKIYALTHVEMLKICSVEFFRILNYYDELEANFMYRIRNAENFVKVDILMTEYQQRPVDSRDVLNAFGLQKKDISFEDESAFEDIENTAIQLLKTWKSKPEERLERLFVIYPGSWKMKAFAGLYLSVTYVTFIAIPIFMNFGGLTLVAIYFIGVLDILWFLIILLGFRVAYIDKTKGDVITDFKYTARAYIIKWDGLFLDLLSVIPFEFIPMFTARHYEDADAELVAWLRTFRLLRAFCIFQHISSESQKITVNVYFRYFRIILYLTVWINLQANLFIALSKDYIVTSAITPLRLEKQQFDAYVMSVEYVINFMASTNIYVLIPTSVNEMFYLNCNSIALPFMKGLIISQVLSNLFIKKLAMSQYKTQVVTVENFLETRETSPSIIKEVLKYKLNLLQFGRSENMPALFKRAPPSLRMAIMKDLYLYHFLDFPLFQDLETLFVEQLVGRLNREIYFPGQKIVEQNDVDHRMYFIHLGEVYIINQTRDKAYVEYVVGRKEAGDYFGEAQGLWFSIPHRFTYRARTVVEAVTLHATDWLDLRRSFPNVSMKIFKKAKALRLL